MDLSKIVTKITRPLLPEGDIIQLIFEDHKPLKDLIQVMKSEQSFDVRVSAFEDFAVQLTAHAKPEELVLYKDMKAKKDLRESALEGDAEHGLADQMVEEIKRAIDPDEKSAKIKVLAELVEHHIKEEENDLLPLFQSNSSEDERLELGSRFLEAKTEVLEMGGDDAPSEMLIAAEDVRH